MNKYKQAKIYYTPDYTVNKNIILGYVLHDYNSGEFKIKLKRLNKKIKSYDQDYDKSFFKIYTNTMLQHFIEMAKIENNKKDKMLLEKLTYNYISKLNFEIKLIEVKENFKDHFKSLWTSVGQVESRH